MNDTNGILSSIYHVALQENSHHGQITVSVQHYLIKNSRNMELTNRL